jgi:hypothetical protein
MAMHENCADCVEYYHTCRTWRRTSPSPVPTSTGCPTSCRARPGSESRQARWLAERSPGREKSRARTTKCPPLPQRRCRPGGPGRLPRSVRHPPPRLPGRMACGSARAERPCRSAEDAAMIAGASGGKQPRPAGSDASDFRGRLTLPQTCHLRTQEGHSNDAGAARTVIPAYTIPRSHACGAKPHFCRTAAMSTIRHRIERLEERCGLTGDDDRALDVNRNYRRQAYGPTALALWAICR